MICSITSSGLAIPPAQNASQMRSILFLSSPVSIDPRAIFDSRLVSKRSAWTSEEVWTFSVVVPTRGANLADSTCVSGCREAVSLVSTHLNYSPISPPSCSLQSCDPKLPKPETCRPPGPRPALI